MIIRLRKLSIILLVVIVMASQMTILPVFAAAGNISASADRTSVENGDIFTVTISSKEMNVRSFIGGVRFNSKVLSVESINGCRDGKSGVFLQKGDGDYVPIDAEVSNDGSKVGFYYIGTTNTAYKSQDFLKVKFRAVRAGDAEISLYENSDGTNGMTVDTIDPGFSVTVTGDSGSNPSTSFHIHASADTNNVRVGDTVRITLRTDAMKVSTFTGGIRFDSSMFKYSGCKGYRSGRTGVYLTKKDGTYREVTVEPGKTGGTIGMFMSNTYSDEYIAGNLVCIELTAIKAGTSGILLYEDSAGYDEVSQDNVQSGISITAAKSGSSNLSATADLLKVITGDTFTVTFGIKKAKLSTFTGGINFDKNIVKVNSISGTRSGYSDVYLRKTNGNYTQLKAETGKSGSNVGFMLTGGNESEYAEQDFMTVTFETIKAGDPGISLYEDSAGYDGYCGDPIDTGFSVKVKDRIIITDDPFEDIDAVTYSGTAVKPEPVLKPGNEYLEGSYIVSYSNNVNAGTAKQTIEFTGEYGGTINKNFAIKKAQVSSVTTEMSSYTATGSAIEPVLIVRGSNGKVLTKGTDYAVSYSNNIAAGTATVNVEGINNYEGTASAKFEIKESGSGDNPGGGGSGGGSGGGGSGGGDPSGEGTGEEEPPEEEPADPTHVSVTLTEDSISINKNGVLEATVSDLQKETIAAAITSETKEVIIDVSIESGTNVRESHVAIPAEILDKAASVGAAVVVNTPDGRLSLDGEAVRQTLQKSSGNDVTVNIAVDEPSKTDSYAEYDVTMTYNSKQKLTAFAPGALTIQLDVPAGLSAEDGIRVLYLKDGYAYKTEYLLDSASRTVLVTVDHLTTFAVMSSSAADLMLIKSVKDSTTGKLSLKAYKDGTIRLSWKKGKGNTPEKYIVYRSTRKKKGYKKLGIVTNDKLTYTDKTGLKKGRKYYYKVRGIIKIDNNNTYTKFSAVKSAKCKKTGNK